MDLDNYLESYSGRGRYACFTGQNRLMFITHRTKKYTELDEIKMVTKGGCSWVQLRMKDNLNLEVAKEVAHFTLFDCDTDCCCCLDDNLEMAIKAGIHCVHLGKNDMPVSEAWRIIVEKGLDDLFLVGATANTFEDILEADREGASYVGLGPYRFTETKKNLSPVLGLEGYQKIMEQYREAGLKIPIFAIGGIQFEDIAHLMETGIEGIAVSGAIINADDPVEETRRFIREINKHKPDPCRDDSEI